MFNLVHLTDDVAGSKVVVAPERGAIITSFRVGGRELLYMDHATLADSSKNVRGGIPVLFPAPGKLDGDSWRYGAHTGTMKQHGFARTLPWQVVASQTNRLKLALESDSATLAQYPFAFRAEITYELRGPSLRIVADVYNRGAEPMPYGLGFHPYFAVTDKAHAAIPTAATQAFDNVTKAAMPFAGFDFTQPELDLHLLDHAASHATLQLADGTRIDIRTSQDFVRWVVWTVAGRDFICLEPWTAPGNALNTGEHLIVLDAGRSHSSWVEIAYRQ